MIILFVIRNQRLQKRGLMEVEQGFSSFFCQIFEIQIYYCTIFPFLKSCACSNRPIYREMTTMMSPSSSWGFKLASFSRKKMALLSNLYKFYFVFFSDKPFWIPCLKNLGNLSPHQEENVIIPRNTTRDMFRWVSFQLLITKSRYDRWRDQRSF